MAKASKQRACPAVGGVISPAECGEGRNSRYRCPADCGYNPFAVRNYDQLLDIETGLDSRTIAWMGRGDAGRAANFVDQVERAARDPSGYGLHATVAWHLFSCQTRPA